MEGQRLTIVDVLLTARLNHTTKNIGGKIPFLFLPQIFAGNTDRNTVITHSLKPHIEARYVRFHPLTHNHNIPCLRAEVYGCRNGKLFICHACKL